MILKKFEKKKIANKMLFDDFKCYFDEDKDEKLFC
jgi:hypothetical protein